MLKDGLRTDTEAIVYGHDRSCCWFCAEEQARKNRSERSTTGLSHDSAARQLWGKFAAKPLFRMPIQGGPYLVCKEHMRYYLNKLEEISCDNNNTED